MTHIQLVPFDVINLTPPFKGDRSYITAADIIRALQDSIFLKTYLTGTLEIELRDVVDSALVLVRGFSKNAPVRLRWSDKSSTHFFSLERVANLDSRLPNRLPNRLPDYELFSNQEGDFLKLLNSSNFASLYECSVDAAKRLMPSPDISSHWMVRSIIFDLTSPVLAGNYYKISHKEPRSGLVRWCLDDPEGNWVLNSTSYLYRRPPDLSRN